MAGYFERSGTFRTAHVCLSLVSVVCCQVEVSATGRSLIQRIPSDCSLSVIAKPGQREGPGPTMDLVIKKNQ